jgi:hypothetical protein
MYSYTLASPGVPNRLIGFNGVNPSNLLSNVAINGLNANERLIGIDIRPSSGQLYGVTTTSTTDAARVVIINPRSGALTQVAPSGTTLPSGQFYGMSFVPGDESIRIISYNTGNNLRINPDTGVRIAFDSGLDYVLGDVNVSIAPVIANIAYRFGVNELGFTTATLYGIDTRGANSVLARINDFDDPLPPSTLGAMRTVGPLRINPATVVGGFDIQLVSNAAFAALSTDGVSSNLYRVNLVNGNTVLVGPIGSGIGLVDGLAIVSVGFDCLDLDGDGVVLPTTDGLMLLRAQMGMTGTDVTNGAIATPPPPRSTWAAIRFHMNSKCGTSFAL